MNFIKQIERMQLMNKLIKEGRTGTPEELAVRLGVSRRQLYTYLEYFKDFGMEICFSRKRNSFVYCDEKEMDIFLRITVLNNLETSNISGGNIFNDCVPCCFSARKGSKLVS